MPQRRFYSSSDYAGLEGKNAKFYYGYERTDKDDNWCFVATLIDEAGNAEEVIPFPELGTDSQFECEECLMAGISIIMDRYQLSP